MSKLDNDTLTTNRSIVIVIIIGIVACLLFFTFYLGKIEGRNLNRNTSRYISELEKNSELNSIYISKLEKNYELKNRYITNLESKIKNQKRLLDNCLEQ